MSTVLVLYAVNKDKDGLPWIYGVYEDHVEGMNIEYEMQNSKEYGHLEWSSVIVNLSKTVKTINKESGKSTFYFVSKSMLNRFHICSNNKGLDLKSCITFDEADNTIDKLIEEDAKNGLRSVKLKPSLD